ncbi:transcription factor bHLH143-like [Primulina huaijiensis]|uniref:transcription factor bHLH143-like n=1 Tax=Primulina huaijiensis TaxID=1492673 RepID=UPI003CC6EC55
MDKDSGSWSHYNSLGSSYDIVLPNTEPARRKLYSVEYPTMRIGPSFPSSEMQQLKASEPNSSHALNSFHLWHRLHPSFTSILFCASRENFLSDTIHLEQKRSPKNCAAPPQKRFLVFDQSGDITTLVYGSMMENPVQYGACLVPNPPPSADNNQIEDEPMKIFDPLNPIMNDKRIEDHSRNDMDHENLEDTEELNALRCSDSDSYYLNDDEEMSTGRSPSTMTHNQTCEETCEEANSFTGPTKRQKLLDGNCDLPFLRRTCSSPKNYACTTLDDEAESTCRDNFSSEEFGSLSCNKRKERTQETLSILQCIFPNLQGNNPVAFIGKTIQYLRTLKVEAKALGYDSG